MGLDYADLMLLAAWVWAVLDLRGRFRLVFCGDLVKRLKIVDVLLVGDWVLVRRKTVVE